MARAFRTGSRHRRTPPRPLHAEKEATRPASALRRPRFAEPLDVLSRHLVAVRILEDGARPPPRRRCPGRARYGPVRHGERLAGYSWEDYDPHGDGLASHMLPSRGPLRVPLRSIAAACYNLDTQIALPVADGRNKQDAKGWTSCPTTRSTRPSTIISSASRRITRSTTGPGKFAVTRDHLAAAIGRVGHSADALEKYLNRG